MRTSSILLSVLLLSCLDGCIIHDYGLNTGRPRADCFHREPPVAQAEDSIPAGHASDTSVYFCAVRFSEDYAWQRDTAYGTEPYDLLLFKDNETILTISSEGSTCTSPDHDTHHIINGHLYTEHSSLTQTSIGRDGEEVVSFPGREFLKGLLPSGDDIYTLSQRRDGDGFTFRKNGEILMTKTGCTLFGSMDNPSYGETGALYLDRGDITFFYWTGTGALRKYFRARNGKEEEIIQFAGESHTDMKPYNGMPLAAGIDLPNHYPVNCSLWILPPDILSAGFFREGNRHFSGIFNATSGKLLEICSGEAVIYCSEETWQAVEYDSDNGTVKLTRPNGNNEVHRDCYFLSPSCAALYGSKFIYALSPRAENGFPKIWTGKGFREVAVHGYISRVAIEVNPAS